MGLAKRSIIPRDLSSAKFDGIATFIGGLPRQGKTSVALVELPKPFLFICKDVSNQTVLELPYVDNSPAGLEHVKKHLGQTLAMRCFTRNENILSVCKDPNRAYCFDEAANLFSSYTMMKEFVEYMREVGYCNGGLRVWLTSQRASKDVWPAIYRACRRIKWVGPLWSEEDARTLYQHRSYNITFEDFCLRLRNLKPYNWQKPNLSESVLVVKDV